MDLTVISNNSQLTYCVCLRQMCWDWKHWKYRHDLKINMISTPFWCLGLIYYLSTPTLGISTISLTEVKDGGPLIYAVRIADRKEFVSLVQCVALCERQGWCVAVAVCRERGPPLVSCDLLSVDVTRDYSLGDNVSNCKVLYSELRLENLESCGGSPHPNQALTPCNLTTTPTTPSSECTTSLGGGCHCPKGATNMNCTTYITDCSSVNLGKGVYTIQPGAYTSPFQVYCDYSKVIIQRRKNCANGFFHRAWLDYKEGFGVVNTTCFWLGNEKIKAIADQDDYTLRVKPSKSILVSTSKYTSFKLGTEAEGYNLQYSEFEKNAWFDNSEDGFGDCPDNQKLQGMKFRTHDNDNPEGCATNRESGWWYNSDCAFGDLNQHDSARWPRNSDAVLTDYDDVSMMLST